MSHRRISKASLTPEQRRAKEDRDSDMLALKLAVLIASAYCCVVAAGIIGKAAVLVTDSTGLFEGGAFTPTASERLYSAGWVKWFFLVPLAMATGDLLPEYPMCFCFAWALSISATMVAARRVYSEQLERIMLKKRSE